MTISLYTERTYTILMGAKLPEGATSLRIPDSALCFDAAQQALTSAYKAAFGATEAKSTFKVAISKKGERNIYEPAVINKNGAVTIEWGNEFYPVPNDASFSSGKCIIEVESGGVEYRLKVRIPTIKKEDAKSKVQLEWASCPADAKADFLAKAWKRGTILDILATAYPDILKLAEVVGTHDVVGYSMGSFEKYVLELADGRLVRANTSLQNKLAYYSEMGISVTPEEPAKLTVETSTAKTTTGHSIYPTTMVSFRNVNLPVFDFSDFAPAKTTTVEYIEEAAY